MAPACDVTEPEATRCPMSVSGGFSRLEVTTAIGTRPVRTWGRTSPNTVIPWDVQSSHPKPEFGSFWVLQTKKLNAAGMKKGNKVVTALQAESSCHSRGETQGN